MVKLTSEFRRWWKGTARIVRIQQGDDNLIAVILRNIKNFTTGVYKKTTSNLPQEKFRLIELNEGLNLNEAKERFNKIVREF